VKRKNVVIIGAAGRDFHNFNMVYRDDDSHRVIAFTAAQIPDIAGRKYPAALAGKLYPKGIPIHPEADLPKLIRAFDVSDCVFAYSDVSYQHVMNVAAVVQAAGANFMLLGPKDTMLKSARPVISVGAVRTGCGKSQTSRRIIEILMAKGLKVVAVRHPMPYGDLAAQKVQRFSRISDLAKRKCTIEEMEEYEPHVVRGNVIYAGVDYEAILRAAENDPQGCDVIVWDGGNNDFPFYKPDLHVTVVDPHRPGHEMCYYPGNVTLRLADVVVINKIDSADAAGIDAVRRNIAAVNPKAVVIDAASVLEMDNPAVVRGKRVLAVEDRCGGRGGAQVRGGGACRPPAVSGRQPQGHLPHLSGHRHGAARHGLRCQAIEGPGGDHQPHRLRCGGDRHPHRSQPDHQNPKAQYSRLLQPSGNRKTGSGHGARRVYSQAPADPQTKRMILFAWQSS
jgi:predicted GTPase